MNMANDIVSSNIRDLIDSWIKDEQEGIQFPVPFDLAWGIAGYSRKDSAKRALTAKNSPLIEGRDFAFHRDVEWTQGGRSSDLIEMTCDAFKHFCLMAKTDQGKEIRQYFIEAEKRWRLVQQVAPEVANEVEIMQMKIELARLEAQKSQSDLQLIQFRHLVTSTMPEPLQQKILGYNEVRTTEYVDRTITPDGNVNDGVGITYIQKRYGFKSTKQAWAWLDSIGMGKMSQYWKHELKAVEASVLPRGHLADLDDMFQDSDRQKYLGE
jgi:anti-repressor protein